MSSLQTIESLTRRWANDEVSEEQRLELEDGGLGTDLRFSRDQVHAAIRSAVYELHDAAPLAHVERTTLSVADGVAPLPPEFRFAWRLEDTDNEVVPFTTPHDRRTDTLFARILGSQIEVLTPTTASVDGEYIFYYLRTYSLHDPGDSVPLADRWDLLVAMLSARMLLGATEGERNLQTLDSELVRQLQQYRENADSLMPTSLVTTSYDDYLKPWRHSV